MAGLLNLLLGSLSGDSVKGVSKLTEEEIKNSQIILKQYLDVKPVKSKQIIAIRVSKYELTNIGHAEGKFIELFMADGTRSFMSNDGCISRTLADVYRLPDSVEIAANALGLIFPRFKDEAVSLYNTGFGNLPGLERDKWKPLALEEIYLENFIKPDSVKKIDENMFDKLAMVISLWKANGALQIVGREGFDGWMTIIDRIGKECDIRIKEKEEQERLKEELREKEEREAQERIRKEQEDEKERIRKEQEDEKRKAIESAGIRGEQEVLYALKWLDDVYKILSDKPIKLKNEEFIDEEQEYDHIIVGPAGVILIETKAYSGTISIDENGNWQRMKKEGGGWVGETNPLQQVRRHEKLIKSFLPKDIPLRSIVCLAKSNVVVKGVNNSPLDIVKVDMLTEHIENIECENRLDEQKICEIIELIKGYIV